MPNMNQMVLKFAVPATQVTVGQSFILSEDLLDGASLKQENGTLKIWTCTGLEGAGWHAIVKATCASEERAFINDDDVIRCQI